LVEAIDHLRRGLAMLLALPERVRYADEELALLLALGPALMSAKEVVKQPVEEIYDRALQLARGSGEAFQLMDGTNERWYEAELHRLRGLLLAARSPGRLAKAESCF
jgi:hypothetical protein